MGVTVSDLAKTVQTIEVNKRHVLLRFIILLPIGSIEF
jgi:hypothetical protein